MLCAAQEPQNCSRVIHRTPESSDASGGALGCAVSVYCLNLLRLLVQIVAAIQSIAISDCAIDFSLI